MATSRRSRSTADRNRSVDDEPVRHEADEPDADPELGLDQLVERSGVSARTIRYYQSEGVLPRPRKDGRDPGEAPAPKKPGGR